MKTFELPAGNYGIAGVRPSPIVVSAFPVVALFTTLVLPAAIADLAGTLAFGAFAFTALLALFPTRVDVGSDGLLVSWLGRRRFLPYARIRSVAVVSARLGVLAGSDRVDVLLESGELLRLTTRRGIGAAAGSREMTHAFAAAIEQGRTAAPAATRPLLLRDPEESARDYMARVRRLAAEAGTAEGAFRAAAIPSDALEARLRDAAAPPDERIGAAIALRVRASALPAELVREIAEGTVHPAVRIAVGADGLAPNDDDLARALERVDEPRRGSA